MKKVGVIVGRFQVPSLTDGHLNLFEQAIKESDELIVFIGVSRANLSSHDPLSYEVRQAMIQKTLVENFLEHKLVRFYPIRDEKQNEVWSADLDYRISEAIDKNCEVTLYGSRDCFIGGYTSSKYSFVEVRPKESPSGTDVRREVAKDCVHTEDFRKGVIYAVTNKYPICFPTVDIAIHDVANDKWLLGKKYNQTQFRFVGGFADPEDDSFEDAAIREVKEETNLDVSCLKLHYLGSAKVNDWRYAKSENKIKTIMYEVHTSDTKDCKPGDDIEEVKWVTWDELFTEDIVEEHKHLRTMLLTKSR